VVCLPERFSTPRIKYWTKERIQEVSVADRVRTGEYGRLDLRSPSDTCYLVAGPGSTGGSFYVPRLSDLLAAKISALPVPDRKNLLGLIREYDLDIQAQSDRIAAAHRAIVERQLEIKGSFVDMIEELLRVRSRGKHASEDPDQDGSRRSQYNEGAYGSVDARSGSVEGGNESGGEAPSFVSLQLTLGMVGQQFSDSQQGVRTDHLPGDQVGRVQRDDVQTPNGMQRDGGSSETNGRDHSLGQVDKEPNTSNLEDLLPSRRLRALLLVADSPFMSVPLMIFGSGVANGKDIMRSFSVGKDLEDMFVQFAIECIKYDDRTKRSLSHVTRVIVDMFTMRALNAEHLHLKDDPDADFTSHRIEKSLDRMLPCSEAMKNTQMILVPMLQHNHWVLYVVNRIMKCIHIIDSNPYGNEMNFTRWQDFHQQAVTIRGKSVRFNKLMMNRLTSALQRVRPNSGFPKFGNWEFKFEHEAPRMKYGSNDCGFF